MDWVAIRAALHAWVVACTGMSTQKVTWARQANTPRPEQDGIIMKLLVVDDEGVGWVDVECLPLVFATINLTAVVGNNFTAVGHALETGDGPIALTGSDLPLPLLEDANYWVIRVDDDTLQLAAEFVDTGGADGSGNPVTPITLLDTGSGVMTMNPTSYTLRAGEEVEHVQRGTVRATLQLFSYVKDDTGADGAIATLRRVASRYRLPTNRALLDAQRIGVTGMERTRSMLGGQDAVLFEPRAWLDVALEMVTEEREVGTIIRQVELEHDSPTYGWQKTISTEDVGG